MRVVGSVLVEHNIWLVTMATIMCIMGVAVAMRLFLLCRDRSGRKDRDCYEQHRSRPRAPP